VITQAQIALLESCETLEEGCRMMEALGVSNSPDDTDWQEAIFGTPFYDPHQIEDMAEQVPAVLFSLENHVTIYVVSTVLLLIGLWVIYPLITYWTYR